MGGVVIFFMYLYMWFSFVCGNNTSFDTMAEAAVAPHGYVVIEVSHFCPIITHRSNG